MLTLLATIACYTVCTLPFVGLALGSGLRGVAHSRLHIGLAEVVNLNKMPLFLCLFTSNYSGYLVSKTHMLANISCINSDHLCVVGLGTTFLAHYQACAVFPHC